jgi:hypothetical protein
MITCTSVLIVASPVLCRSINTDISFPFYKDISVDAAQFVFSDVAVHRALQLLSDEMLVAEVVEGACRANRGAAVKVLVIAVVEAFVNAKLERTDASTAPYAAAAEPQGAAIVRRLSKRIQRALTVALAEAARATVEDMEFVALIFYSAMEGATRGVGGWCAGRWWFVCAKSC